nr:MULTISPECIES: hypothetical protein [Providencia]
MTIADFFIGEKAKMKKNIILNLKLQTVKNLQFQNWRQKEKWQTVIKAKNIFILQL